MNWLLNLIEKEGILFFNSGKAYLNFVLTIPYFIFMVMRPGIYTEFLIFFPIIWITNSNLLEMLVYKDKIQGRLPHLSGFGFRIYHIIVGKSLFITGISVFAGACLVFLYRIITSNLHFGDIHFLLEVLFIDFFVITLSTFLIFKYAISRAINIILVFVTVLFLVGRKYIPHLSIPNHLHVWILVTFIIADFFLIRYIRKKKNEFFF